MTITALNVLLISAKYCEKDTIFNNLNTITQKGDMKTRQMTPFFHVLFKTHSNFLGNSLSKFIFMGSVSPLVHSGLQNI